MSCIHEYCKANIFRYIKVFSVTERLKVFGVLHLTLIYLSYFMCHSEWIKLMFLPRCQSRNCQGWRENYHNSVGHRESFLFRFIFPMKH